MTQRDKRIVCGVLKGDIRTLRQNIAHCTVSNAVWTPTERIADKGDRICPKCMGEGKVADSTDQEPWSYWAKLPPGSDVAVKLGIVKPIDCPQCGGKGRTEIRR